MKFIWIIWTCSTVINSINARRIEFTIKLQREPNNSTVNTLDSISKGNNGSSDIIQQNKLKPFVTQDGIDGASSKNKRLMPKIMIKQTYDLSYLKNSSYAPITRRPLMKKMKFTAKPHVIHYVQPRLQDDQRYLSETKNPNKRNRFKPQNNRNTNIPEDSDSTDDKFKTFIDIGDTDKQRDNFLATAASDKKSITIHSLLNTDEIRSYSKRAFEESLENIRNIRSRKKTNIHSSQKNTDPAPTQTNNNIVYIVLPSTIKNPAEILTASENLALMAKLTEESINSAKFNENVFHVVNLTETINSYDVSTTEKLQFTEEDNSAATQIEHILFPAIRDADDIVPTTKELIDKKLMTESFDNLKEEKNIVDNETTTEKIVGSDVETPVDDIPHLDVVNTENNSNHSSYKAENVSDTETTTYRENFSPLATSTEKTDGSMYETKKPLYYAEIISTWPFSTADITAAVESSGKTVLKSSEKTLPLLVIVAGNSISSPELNEAIRNGNILKEKIDTNKDEEKVMKEDNFRETPISVKDEESIRMTHHLALRKKRRINVIEEERVSTTSNLSKFEERDRIIVDCTFRNIHA